ncbi:MAG: B12-binding domain-containing radical SAM protein [Candidatus Geothermincolia bacterium]
MALAHMGEYLDRNGVSSLVRNIAGEMQEHPAFDVAEYLASESPLAFVLFLDRVEQVQGATEMARLCKHLHPNTAVICFGYAASFFSHSLTELPEVDFVIRGDSPEEPLRMLMDAMRGRVALADIPNLSYKSASGVIENELEYVPASLEHLGDCYTFLLRSAFRYGGVSGLRRQLDPGLHPFTEVQVARGCSGNCIICNKSRSTGEAHLGRRAVTLRNPNQVAHDVEVICGITAAQIHISGDLRVGGDEYACQTLEILSHLAPDNTLVLHLCDVAGREYFEQIASCIPHFDLQLMLFSHDEELREFCGKKFSNEDLERNITWAFESGCERFDLVLVMGLPGQAPESVIASIDYCGRLMRRFGPKLNPMLQTVAPMLPPGTVIHENAPRLEYRLLAERLEDYRGAMLTPNWRDAMNYETRWMDRQLFTETSYNALLELNRLKARHGLVTHHRATWKERQIRNSLAILKHMEEGGFSGPNANGAGMQKMRHDVEQANLAFSTPAYLAELKSVRHFHHVRLLKTALGRT